MKNLKKVLALVLAFACAFTMFAGAAFTDQADIKVDSEVVDTLVSLGIVRDKEQRGDLYLILSVLVLFAAGSIILYYIGWNNV